MIKFFKWIEDNDLTARLLSFKSCKKRRYEVHIYRTGKGNGIEKSYYGVADTFKMAAEDAKQEFLSGGL